MEAAAAERVGRAPEEQRARHREAERLDQHGRAEEHPRQQQAVRYIDGPCLVLAGAGSGKTSVITTKIAYLVQTCGMSARRIAHVVSATGISVMLLLTVTGVDFPVLWGFLAFFLNFIPNIGSVIAAIPR
ncbi:AI-2E family transporter, partial [Halomonas neptunia]